MSTTILSASDFLAVVYLTDYRGADRDHLEARAADAASIILREHCIGFEAALAAAADHANGEDADLLSLAAHAHALAAAVSAVAEDLRGTDAFVNLGWR